MADNSVGGGGSGAVLSKMKQEHRQVRLKTALPEDHLIIHSMRMSEALSTPFEIDLDMYSDDPEIDPNTVLGHNMTVGLDRNINGERYFNGYFRSFGLFGSRERKYIYRGVAVPWLWFLTLTENCRIFHEKSAVDIAKKIFGEHGFGDFRFQLNGNPSAYKYCVQYRESDFNFISRLFEKEGLYYYFHHENGRHEMVIVDDVKSHPKEPGYESIEFKIPDDVLSRRRENIHSWRQSNNILTTKFVHQDYDFMKPRADLTTRSSIPRQHAASNMEVYQYPGEYYETGLGDTYAQVRMEEKQTGYSVAQSESNARGIKTGHRFEMSLHPVEEFNQEYLITSAHHEVVSDDYYSSATDNEETYHATFTAIPTTSVFRPPRVSVKPLIMGPQTAVVRNETAGEEIEPDEFGRVKVQFDWEREDIRSCWIRVSQTWAGAGWGGMSIPRDGQEVIVEYVDGNPDRPIITGRVYNGKSEFPYEPKARPTVTTFKTNSSKGGGGYNELRFDDLKGEENIFVHAEKTMDVRVKDVRKDFVGSSHHEIVGGSAFQKTGEDKHQTVGGEWRVMTEDDISIITDTDAYHKVGGDTAIDSGGEVHIKAGAKAVIQAVSGISLHCGGNFVNIDNMGVTIKGTMVKINSGGAKMNGKGERAQDPEEPAAALDDSAGQISERARGRSYVPEQTALDSHAVAASLLNAAATGAVTCQVCGAMAGGS